MNWPALRSELRRTNYAGRPVTLAEGAAVSALLATGTALAGILRPGGYRPAAGEKVAVVLCGANTDPSDLMNRNS